MANAAGDLAGYNVYRKLETCAGSGTTTLIATLANVLTYTDTTIPSVTTAICAKIASRDVSGNVSAQSTGTDETLTPPGGGETFAYVTGVSTTATGADLTFAGLAHSIRYWTATITTKQIVPGLGGVASYHHTTTWNTTDQFACYEAMGSDEIWQTLEQTCNVTVVTGDTTAPTTPSGLSIR